MTSRLEKQLFQTATLIFDELAFMLPVPEPDDDQEQAIAAAVSVEFQGPFRGRLILGASQELLPTLAANMLGEENAGSPGQQLDALGEVANVICGNVLPVIAGSEQVFQIAAPEVCDSATVLGSDRDSPAAEVHLPLDEGYAQVLLFLQHGALL